MKLNISKLRRKLVRDFIPVGYRMREEGKADGEIVDAFNSLVEEKKRQFYANKTFDFAQFNKKTLIDLCKSAQMSTEDHKIKPTDYGPGSKAEMIFADILERAKIPFKAQYEIKPYRVDFLVCGELIVEIDGPHHSGQKEYDEQRDNYLSDYGYKIVRYPIWLIAMDHNDRGILSTLVGIAQLDSPAL